MTDPRLGQIIAAIPAGHPLMCSCEKCLAVKFPDEPVSITVDRIFELLSEALNYAIGQGGVGAKSTAWDVHYHFTKEIGHYRTSAVAKPCAQGDPQ